MSQYQSRLAALTTAQREILAAKLFGSAEEQATARKGSRAPQLVAHLEAASDDENLPRQLVQHCAERLPDYMVPRQFEFYTALPRLASGKIDRTRLRNRPLRAINEDGARGTASAGVSDEIQTTLVRIWKEVLGLDELDPNDDFFEVGGDSLLSIRILARANREGLHITPEEFFAQPTVAAQAAAVRAASVPTALEQRNDSIDPYPLAQLDADDIDTVAQTLAALDDLDDIDDN